MPDWSMSVYASEVNSKQLLSFSMTRGTLNLVALMENWEQIQTIHLHDTLLSAKCFTKPLYTKHKGGVCITSTQTHVENPDEWLAFLQDSLDPLLGYLHMEYADEVPFGVSHKDETHKLSTK